MTQSIKRVVVSLDAASETAPAIDTAARLAARWQVPLHGVFIEDEELISLAGLPFARQVTLATGREPLTKDHIEDHFRALAERSRRELAAVAARHGIEWSFEVVRGPLAAAALGGEHDFVIAGATSRPVGGHFRIASRWWSLLAIITRPLLLAKRDWESGGSVLALLRHHGPQSERTLDIAAQIAGICKTTLTSKGIRSVFAWSRPPQSQPRCANGSSRSTAGYWCSKAVRTRAGPRNCAISSSRWAAIFSSCAEPLTETLTGVPRQPPSRRLRIHAIMSAASSCKWHRDKRPQSARKTRAGLAIIAPSCAADPVRSP
jgi:nucleotide-binding universal stress UspA family protein